MEAPEAVNTISSALQAVVGPAMETVGASFTVTVTEALLEQPAEEVPVTEYVPPVDTTMVASVEPLDQTYEAAPPACSVVVLGWQTTVLPEMLIVGRGFTVTNAVAVAVQPLEPVPVTV